MTLTVAHGTLTLASTAGLSFGAGDGTADATMTFSGTAAAINAALGAGLTYNPTANYNGPDSITVLTTDNGQTGTGGTCTDSDTVAITINSVNDAPSGANNTLTGSEDDPLVFTAADFGFTDPIDGNAFLAVIIDTFPANGTLFLDVDGPGGNPPVDLSTLGPGVFVSVTDINLGHLYFQPDTDEFGDGYAQFTFRVQDDGGMLNGGVDRDPIGEHDLHQHRRRTTSRPSSISTASPPASITRRPSSRTAPPSRSAAASSSPIPNSGTRRPDRERDDHADRPGGGRFADPDRRAAAGHHRGHHATWPARSPSRSPAPAPAPNIRR